MPLIFLPPTVTLFVPTLCDFLPVRDLSPWLLHEDNHDLGSAEFGLEERHTLAGAGPMTSANFIHLFNK